MQQYKRVYLYFIKCVHHSLRSLNVYWCKKEMLHSNDTHNLYLNLKKNIKLLYLMT